MPFLSTMNLDLAGLTCILTHSKSFSSSSRIHNNVTITECVQHAVFFFFPYLQLWPHINGRNKNLIINCNSSSTISRNMLGVSNIVNFRKLLKVVLVCIFFQSLGSQFMLAYTFIFYLEIITLHWQVCLLIMNRLLQRFLWWLCSIFVYFSEQQVWNKAVSGFLNFYFQCGQCYI